MKAVTDYETFACRCVPLAAKALDDHDFEAFQALFDPQLDNDFTADQFTEQLNEQEEELGQLKDHQLLGHVLGNEEYDSVRFVFKGRFDHGEGLIILCVHEREDEFYLNEHVYYW